MIYFFFLDSICTIRFLFNFIISSAGNIIYYTYIIENCGKIICSLITGCSEAVFKLTRKYAFYWEITLCFL